MAEARLLADQGEDAAPDGTLIWAREQTEGRGRRGNTWDSPKGNFYSSLIVRPDVQASRAAELSFVTGCAVFDTVGEVCDPGFECRLKWPNDILLNDAKIGGLLLETKAEAGQPVEYVIIGLGVNLKSHPKDTPFPATDFVDQGQMIPDTVFLEAYARHFMEWAAKWVEDGFEPIRQQWKWRAEGIGKDITVRLNDKTLEGVFEDIAEDGALLLNQDGNIRKIAAGEVYFAPAKEG
ncbi:MAG: biotin--[acetyl-CoA-carboxylase] ligase [Rhodospirillales bacterium]|nr:biotin--[acetyl-CoA-carboxylase] ligase [Rhodospirillales bacterium]MBO6786717.1 biotin--[acetyl-CoA-carboxylase] ligase [Rhodospirillales bacterium]